MKKDQYLQDLLKAPPKQKAHIQLFDQKTLREAFYVSPTGLPTYNKASIEGADPKEKEAKRLKVLRLGPGNFFCSVLFFSSGNAGKPKRKSVRNSSRLRCLVRRPQHQLSLRYQPRERLAHPVQLLAIRQEHR